MRDRTVVHLTPSVSVQSGGVPLSVRHLSQATQVECHADIIVLGLRDSQSDANLPAWAPLPVRVHKVIGPAAFGCAPSLYKDLLQTDPELIHLHGAWRYLSIVAYHWARRTGRPYVVSPHGMLEPWALRQSRFRKWVAAILYQGPCLRKAACLRATSELEAKSIRLAGYRNPIVLVPNGVEFPPKPLPSDSRPPDHPGRMLFLSRIHPKKGLLNLVRAWSRVRPEGWELFIVGPDEQGHKAKVWAEVKKYGLIGQIHFPGEVWGESKTQMYRDSDVFVLPTFSENFGLVIAEALSCELPVITTRGTPWQELTTHKCGWWVDIGVDPLVDVLKEIFATRRDVLHEMGVRGRLLVEQKYSWGPVGKEMAEVYLWMLGRRPMPECVIDP